MNSAKKEHLLSNHGASMTTEKVLLGAIKGYRESEKALPKIQKQKSVEINNFLKAAFCESLFLDKRYGEVGQYSWSYILQQWSPPEPKLQGCFIFTKKEKTELKIPVRFMDALGEHDHKLAIEGKNEAERKIILKDELGNLKKSKNLRRHVNLYSQPFFVIKAGMSDEDILAYLCLYVSRENFFPDDWAASFLQEYVSKLAPYFENPQDMKEAIQDVISRLFRKPEIEKVLAILKKLGFAKYSKKWESSEPLVGKEGLLALVLAEIRKELPPDKYSKFVSVILKDNTSLKKSLFGWPHSEHSLKGFIQETLKGIKKEKDRTGYHEQPSGSSDEAAAKKKKKEKYSSNDVKTVQEVVTELKIPPRFIYRAIENGKIIPQKINSTSRVSVGEIELKRVKRNYKLTPENIDQINKHYHTKEMRKYLVNLLAEQRKITERAARRWIKRRLDKGLTLNQIEKEIRSVSNPKDRSEKENAIIGYLTDTEGLSAKEAEAYLNLEKSKGCSLEEITKRILNSTF